MLCASATDCLQYAALHIEHEDFVSQRIGHVNPIGGGIDGNSRRPFEKSFSAFQATDGSPELPARVENKNLANLGIRYINVVLCVHGDALRRKHRILVFISTLDELVLVLFQVEDVNSVCAGVGNDRTPTRIHDNAVRPDKLRMFGLTYQYV